MKQEKVFVIIAQLMQRRMATAERHSQTAYAILDIPEPTVVHAQCVLQGRSGFDWSRTCQTCSEIRAFIPHLVLQVVVRYAQVVSQDNTEMVVVEMLAQGRVNLAK